MSDQPLHKDHEHFKDTTSLGKLPGTSVVIASPMGDMCHASYTGCLIKMFAFTLMSDSPGLNVGFLQYGTSILPMSRQLLAVRAIEANADYMLWIDSDMEFPPDMILRFLKRADAEHRVIGANCMARRAPFTLTARDEQGEQVYTTPASTGLEQVSGIGFGVVFLATSVLREIEMPWFELKWLPEKAIFRGEDFGFCDKLNDAGIPIHIDHDISKDVKHTGTFGYSPLYSQPPTEEGTNDGTNSPR
jgi:hypothetical protein